MDPIQYIRDIQRAVTGARYRNADELLRELVEIPWFRREVRDCIDLSQVGYSQKQSKGESNMNENKPLLSVADIRCEEYREIVFVNSGTVYRINNPVELYIRPGGTTHRVVDAEGVSHCYPAPEKTGLTVIRWKAKNGEPPVKF